MKISKETLEKLQDIEYDVLCTLDDEILKKNNIKYYLRGGSALGAIKYNGFIPWDDDIDIILERKEFDLFIEKIREKKEFEKFSIQSYKYDSGITYYIPRIIINENIRKEFNLPKNTNMGLVVMDIIPIDSIPDNYFERKIYFLKLMIIRTLLASYNNRDKELISKHSNLKKTILKIIDKSKINSFYTPLELLDKMDKIFKKYKYKNTKNSGSILGSLGCKEVMPIDFWGIGVKVNFRNRKFLVPNEYDFYLKKLYGENYFTYSPNESEKKSHLFNKK